MDPLVDEFGCECRLCYRETRPRRSREFDTRGTRGSFRYAASIHADENGIMWRILMGCREFDTLCKISSVVP